jgi:hypothetical protein
LKVQRDGRDFTVEVTADGEGLVSHAGSALLAQMADRTGLTKALPSGLASMRRRHAGHDPGRVVRDLAVMLTDGGQCLADLVGLRDQNALFGAVASDSTAYRVIERLAIRAGATGNLGAAHAKARVSAWKLGLKPQRATLDRGRGARGGPRRRRPPRRRSARDGRWSGGTAYRRRALAKPVAQGSGTHPRTLLARARGLQTQRDTRRRSSRGRRCRSAVSVRASLTAFRSLRC